MATKKPQTNTFPLKVQRGYTYNGIVVKVEIDFEAEEVSIIDETKKVKKWTFSGRGIEFMDAWCEILDAMKYAIGEAKKELQEQLDIKKEEEIKYVSKMQKLIDDNPIEKIATKVILRVFIIYVYKGCFNLNAKSRIQVMLPSFVVLKHKIIHRLNVYSMEFSH